MTHAPETIAAARTFLIANVPGLAGAEVGIVGDTAHAATGTSYHLGKDQLASGSYSIVESSRDRSGLTNAAAAIDIGSFSFTVGGKTHTLRTFSAWLVDQCKAGAADTKDIREVIYSTDGQTVRRWDRLGRRTTGDGSHRWHTHISYFRDSEKRDKTALFKRYLTEVGLLEDEVTEAQLIAAVTKALASTAGQKAIGAGAWNHAEPDPATGGKTVRRTGGDMRSMESRAAARQAQLIAAITAAAKGDDATLAAIVAKLDATPGLVVDELLDASRSVEDTAAALRVVLGDRAAQVGQLLAS